MSSSALTTFTQWDTGRGLTAQQTGARFAALLRVETELGAPLVDLTGRELRDWLGRQAVGNRQRSFLRGCLELFYVWAHAQGLVAVRPEIVNPAERPTTDQGRRRRLPTAPIADAHPTIRAFIDHQRLRGVLPTSLSKTRYVLGNVEAGVGCPLITATTEQILGFLDPLPIQPRSRYAYLSHLAGFYRWAVINGHCAKDPTPTIPRPRLRAGMPRPIGDEDLARALEQASSNRPLRTMLKLAAYCGLRCAEIASLRIDDVLLTRDPPLLQVMGKGAKTRIVPIHPDLVADLRASIDGRRAGPVFAHAYTGVPLKPEAVSGKIRRFLQDECGIPAAAHQLRHWYATAVYESSGHDLRMTQELLGHASPVTTSIYTKWSQGRSYEAVSQLNPRRNR